MGTGRNSLDQKVGDADIIKVGHTDSPHFGQDHKAQPRTKVTPRDLELPTTS